MVTGSLFLIESVFEPDRIGGGIETLLNVLMWFGRKGELESWVGFSGEGLLGVLAGGLKIIFRLEEAFLTFRNGEADFEDRREDAEGIGA